MIGKDGTIIDFPPQELIGSNHMSEKAIWAKNQRAWNERTISLPLPTTWMKTGS